MLTLPTIVHGKRPLVFPFLVSVLHTAKGYSASNGFMLNAIAGFFTLFLFYFILKRIFSGGLALLGMLLLASFPVYIIGVSSSGFEIVNLLFALIAFLLLDVYLEKREPRHAELLGLTLVLLAQVRYESALFVLCLVPPIIAAMGKEQIRGLTWRTPLLPLLFCRLPGSAWPLPT